MIRTLSRVTRFLRELVRAQHRDQLVLRSAALAYTTLVSLVPLLTIALVTVSRVQPERAEEFVRSVAGALPFSPARVRATLTLLAERTAALGWVAVIFSAVITLHLFYQIEEVINTIWGLPYRRRWQWRLVSLLMVLLWGPLLLTALFSGLYGLYSLPWFGRIAPLARPLPALIAVAALTAVYRWVPHTRVRWRAALIGAAVATVALAAIHTGFQAYLRYAPELNVIYGSLSLVLFFLVSLFFFWLAILLGAEASWVIGHPMIPRLRARTGTVLRVLAEAHRDGGIGDQRSVEMLGESCADVLFQLAQAPEIVLRTPEGWRLARGPGEITVGEVRGRVGSTDEADTWPPGATLATVIKEATRMENSGAKARADTDGGST